MKNIKNSIFEGERALFGARELKISDSIFQNGESPLKESANIELTASSFRWKYPLWYAKNIKIYDGTWFDMARAGVWYTDNISVDRAVIQAPKNFRRCDGLSLSDVLFTDAKETLWHCKNVDIDNVSAKGDYFAMNSSDMKVNKLTLDGNYSFDGVKNVLVTNSRLLSKDAFWNSENVTVKDSYIVGEYLGWNSSNLTFENCTIESLQGMCYIKNLKLINCKLINTTLAFEYSDVEAEITGAESIFNPASGTIRADYIKELILEKSEIDPAKTRIICEAIDKTSEKPEWKC